MTTSKFSWTAWPCKVTLLLSSALILAANSYSQAQESALNWISIPNNPKWQNLYSNSLHDAFLGDKSEGNINTSVDVWVLINLKPETKLTDGSRSILTKRRYDCLNQKYSIYLFKSYSEYFGKGKLIAERVDQIIWRTYEPDSDAEHILNIVCKKH